MLAFEEIVLKFVANLDTRQKADRRSLYQFLHGKSKTLSKVLVSKEKRE